MNGQDYEQLTLFQEDSHASLFPLPGSAEARTMTVTSGQRCYESYASFSQLGCLVKMCLESSIWRSTRCLLTWKALATPHKRLLFQLAVSMPHTDDTGSQFWHTPKASDAEMGMTAKTSGRPIEKSTHLQTQVYCVEQGLIPTPKASATLGGCSGARKTLQRMADKGLITEEERRNLSAGNGGKVNPVFVEWLMGYTQQFTKLLPTPRAVDCKNAVTSRYYTHTHTHTARIPSRPERACGDHSAWENWPAEPDVGRVVDGIPDRVDRLKCLGNAVVPQQFYPFFAAIAEIEGK